MKMLTVVIKKTFTNNSQVFVLDEGKKRGDYYPSYELLSSVNIQSRWRAWPREEWASFSPAVLPLG